MLVYSTAQLVIQIKFSLNESHSRVWNPPGQNTGAGSLSLRQGILLTQESNQVSCISGRLFTNWATREGNNNLELLEIIL